MSTSRVLIARDYDGTWYVRQPIGGACETLDEAIALVKEFDEENQTEDAE